MAGIEPDRTRRAVLALAAWTAVVAIPAMALSGPVLFWDEHDHLARASSGAAAVLASDALAVFLAMLLGATLALPLLVARSRRRGAGTSTVATLVGLTAGMVPPLVLTGLLALFTRTPVAAGVFGLVVASAGALTAVGAVGTTVERLRRRWHDGSDRRDDSGARRAWSLDGTDGAPRPRRTDGGAGEADDPLPWTACCWNYWLVGALVVGLLVGGSLGVPLGGAVETWDGTPTAAFDFETTETADGMRLTIVHDGGDPLRADQLRLQGNLTTVPGANQTRAGPWNGSTTHVADARRPGPHVAPGDAVAVGITEDCVVRVIWEDPAGRSATLGKYTCERGGVR